MRGASFQSTLSLLRPLEQVGALAADWPEREAPSFDAALVSPAAAAASLGPRVNARAVCEWVRDTISFEAYRGARRGARGTLISGAGNSWDHALLVGALLDELRVPWRLVRARLPEPLAFALLDRSTGTFTLEGALEADRRRDAADVMDHAWVQVNEGGAWRDCEASVPGVGYGEAVADGEPVAPEDVALGNVEVALFLQTGERASRVASLYVPWEEGTFRHLDVRVVRQADEWVPTVSIGRAREEGEAFAWSPSSSLRVEVSALQQGRSTRARFALAGAESPVADLPGVGLQASLFVLPGWVSTNYADAVEATGAERVDWMQLDGLARAGDAAWSRADREAALAQLGTLSSMRLARWASVADASGWGDAMLVGAAPTLRSPRVVAALSAVGREDGAWHLLAPHAGISAVASSGAPEPSRYALSALSGLRWSQAATVALGASDTFEPMMERATEGGAALVTAHADTLARLGRLPYTASTQARLSSAVNEEGRGVLLPNRVGQGDLLRWLSWTPTTAVTHAGGESGTMASWRWASSGEAASLVGAFAFASRRAASAEPDGCAAMCSLRSFRRAVCSDERDRHVPSVSECVEANAPVGASLFVATGCSALARPLQCGGAWVDARVVAGAGRVTSPPWAPAGMVVPAFSGGCSCE